MLLADLQKKLDAAEIKLTWYKQPDANTAQLAIDHVKNEITNLKKRIKKVTRGKKGKD